MTAGPADWLAKAEGDFRSTCWEMQAPEVNFDAVLFHAQQCIEKLLKGILSTTGKPVEKVHDLNLLAHLVKGVQPT